MQFFNTYNFGTSVLAITISNLVPFGNSVREISDYTNLVIDD